MYIRSAVKVLKKYSSHLNAPDISTRYSTNMTQFLQATRVLTNAA